METSNSIDYKDLNEYFEKNTKDTIKKYEIINKQFDDLLKLYKEYIRIFNNWESTKNEDVDYANYDLLIDIFHGLTDLLVWNNIIEKDGIKHYRVIETGEII